MYLVLFIGNDCPGCESMINKLNNLNVNFSVVNVENEPEYALEMMIMSVPTLLKFKDIINSTHNYNIIDGIYGDVSISTLKNFVS